MVSAVRRAATTFRKMVVAVQNGEQGLGSPESNVHAICESAPLGPVLRTASLLEVAFKVSKLFGLLNLVAGTPSEDTSAEPASLVLF